ncbi:geraniol 8-hydroxylase-like [Cornus florida]|uniref:geraniol 8-hydroxylase-like n=1 Tax=Cornus florida TaxID=4283 RepID=UPI0028A046A5|nr:geraniol 8-hydroxylase-like [Cornus florida]
MDLLSFILCVLFIWTSVQGLLSIANGTKASPGKLPPGPAPLPFIGNILKLSNQPHKSLSDLAKTYGPIMTLKLGQITTVVISSSTMAREILQTQDLSFSNRFVPDAARARDHHLISVSWLPVSTQWRKLRKILNSHVFSSQKLDAQQQPRCQKVLELIDFVHSCSKAGVAVDFGQAAFRTSLKLLSNTIFSVNLIDPGSDIAQQIKELVRGAMEEAGKPNLADYFPFLRKFDIQGIRSRMEIHLGKMFGFLDSMINKRLEMRKFHGYIKSNDVLDTLLSISEENSDEIDRIHIQRLLSDLLAAGTDTTSSTLEWAMAEILHNPQTLSKAKAEIEQVVGKGKPVEESDIARLPYLQAIIKETFRLHPAVPFLVPRKVDENVEVSGFTVPKGAQVIVNVWAIGRDPSVWANHESFMPERFLGSEVDVRGRNFELLPFGSGRRICPGMPLAIRMVHLMLGSLINLFDWKLEDGITPEDLNMEEKFGFTLQKAQPLLAIPIHV